MSTPSIFSGLEPSRLWEHFAAITRIGRPSGEEAAMADYVGSWARGRGIGVLRDAFGNLCLQVPASPGREGAPVVVLQGHLDMVCTDSPQAAPEFGSERGKIRVVRKAYPDGDYLEADMTTLGADNGIAIATMCAIAEDPEAPHGPLDLLMTVEEETGLVGAVHLDPSIIRGRVMLNLDSEDDDVLFVGCAGGGDSRIRFTRKAEAAPEGYAALRMTIDGLKGGHSGLEIDKNRLNGIKAVARLLQQARHETSLRLGAIDGGDRHNAIPRRASAVVALPRAELAAFRERLRAAFGHLVDQYRGLEDGISLDVEELESAGNPAVFGDADTRVLLEMLRIIPFGVDTLSQSIPGLVETSNNLAIIQTHGATMDIFCSTRSSVAPAFRDMVERLSAIASLAGCEFEESPGYPGWKANLDSQILQVVRRTYQKLFDSAPHVTAVHAGLEAGVILDKIPGMDVVSFGPNIRGAHAPGERVSINSVGKFYRLLKATLDDLSSRNGSSSTAG